MSCRCAAMKWMARLIVSQQKESKVKARRTRGQEKRQEDIIGRDGNENGVLYISIVAKLTEKPLDR